jgi:glycosyltransferase involved in cell wall biosynthesis
MIVVTMNEGERLEAQLKRMLPYQDHVDVIVSDTASSDGSTDPDFLKSVGVRALVTSSTRGLSLATRLGYAYAMEEEYEGVITIDANGKDGVEAIPEFVRLLDEGYDLIQGSRFKKGGVHKNTPLERYLGVRFVMAPLLALGCGFYYTDPTNAFRGCSMKFLKDPRVQPLRDVFMQFNIHHYVNYRAAVLGFKVTELPVVRVYPDDGSIPTKIHSFRTKFLIVWEMVLTVLGRYNP